MLCCVRCVCGYSSSPNKPIELRPSTQTTRGEARRGETRQTKGDNKSNKCQATTTTKVTTTAICSFIIAAAKFMRTTRTSDRLHCPADPIELMSSSRGNTPPAPLPHSQLPLLLTLPHPPTENNSAMSQRKDTLRVRKMTQFVCYKKFMVRSSDLFCAHTDTANTF